LLDLFFAFSNYAGFTEVLEIVFTLFPKKVPQFFACPLRHASLFCCLAFSSSLFSFQGAGDTAEI
jgi:hypothetical protein